MIEGRTEIKKAFLSGTSRRIQFQIVDRETGAGFQPSTLTMSIYDVSVDKVVNKSDQAAALADPVTQAIVNDRNDVDMIAFVDSSGFVDITLEPEDVTIDVVDVVTARRYRRLVLFTWTWDSPAKVGKHEIVLSIAPDREVEAV